MARTIEQIKETITSQLQTSFTLSTSAAAEWRLWVHCMAYCIHMFEIGLDLFKADMDADAKNEVAGSLIWYNSKCYDFQLNRELLFNETTGLLEYASDDESARIIKIASVNVSDGTIFFRVATKNDEGEIIPLSDAQLLNFKNYIDAIKFAGTRSQVISTLPDTVKYNLIIYYDPSSPIATIEESARNALTEFKTSQKFGGVIYTHKLLEAITAIAGVVTVKVVNLQVKSSEDIEFREIDTISYLSAGYFNYADDSELTLMSIKSY